MAQIKMLFLENGEKNLYTKSCCKPLELILNKKGYTKENEKHAPHLVKSW